ncbi:MAG: hypothetical protein Q8K61_00515 [Gallionella sp.]|nr:hypothetical protein [Gallionella sp.]
MKRLLVMLMCFSTLCHAELGADELAGLMRQAKSTSGFAARMNVLVTRPDGVHGTPFKVAVIGRFSADKQQLRVNGISPDLVRGRFFAAESARAGDIRAVSYRAPSEAKGIDSDARLFDSSLVLWDMFSPWWSWRRQTMMTADRINGRECVTIRSSTDDKNSTVREVESCVDVNARLSLRTRLYDAHHALIRTVLVGQAIQKADTSIQTAKKLTITDADGVVTQVEVYSGDEQYQIAADAFAALDAEREQKSGAR